MFEEKATKDKLRDFPDIMCVITGGCGNRLTALGLYSQLFDCAGKGPQKAYYEKLIATKNFTKVKICTVWLSAEDYPIMLGEFRT